MMACDHAHNPVRFVLHLFLRFLNCFPLKEKNFTFSSVSLHHFHRLPIANVSGRVSETNIGTSRRIK